VLLLFAVEPRGEIRRIRANRLVRLKNDKNGNVEISQPLSISLQRHVKTTSALINCVDTQKREFCTFQRGLSRSNKMDLPLLVTINYSGEAHSLSFIISAI
jgi:hypothetical protein